MKKRLRKKLHRGEFRELGFSFDAKFKADTEMQVVEAWLQELASLLNSHSLEMGEVGIPMFVGDSLPVNGVVLLRKNRTSCGNGLMNTGRIWNPLLSEN